MGFIITLSIISLVITLFVFAGHEFGRRSYAWSNTAFSFVLSCFIGAIICLVILFSSYMNYLSMMEQKYTIEQEATSIEELTKRGVSAFVFGQMSSREITDFKFGDYQDNIASFISSLRYEIQDYNETLIGKQILKQSSYWGTLIYYPAEAGLLEPLTMKAVMSDAISGPMPPIDRDNKPVEKAPAKPTGGI